MALPLSVDYLLERINYLINNCNILSELNFAAHYLPYLGGHPPEIPANRRFTTAIVNALWQIDDIDPNAWERIFPLVIRRVNDRRQFLQSNSNSLNNMQKGGGIIKNNPWIIHVKSFAKTNKITYKDAMKNEKCKSS